MATIERESLPGAGPAGTGAVRERAFERAVLTSCVLAWLGATISALLMRTHSDIPGLLCPVRSGCEAVLTSRYAAILGVRLPWFGIAFYLTLLALLLTAYGTASQKSRVRLLGSSLAVSVLGAGFSAVLMFIQFAVLRAFCPLCTASALVVGGLLIASAKAEGLATDTAFPGRCAGALTLGIFALVSAAPHLVTESSGTGGVLATVDGRAFTREQMAEDLGASIQPLQRSIHALESEWVRKKVEDALLGAEAKKSKTTVADLLTARMAAVKPGSDPEIDARLASKGLARTPETIGRVKDELVAESRERARTEYLEELARNHRIEVFLKQPEVTALKIDLASAKVSGPPDAKVQLVVFSDFECEHCADLSAVLKRVRTDFPNEVLVAYRYFPIERHARAFPAAVAAECAAEQGAFWEYHDGLYAKGSDLSDASFALMASALGLDAARFRECQTSPRARAAVEASRSDAIASGLDGVPALFFNGRRVGGMIDYENLVRRIRDVLKTSTTATGGAHEGQGSDRKETK